MAFKEVVSPRPIRGEGVSINSNCAALSSELYYLIKIAKHNLKLITMDKSLGNTSENLISSDDESCSDKDSNTGTTKHNKRKRRMITTDSEGFTTQKKQNKQ